jgi:hypothetical protein
LARTTTEHKAVSELVLALALEVIDVTGSSRSHHEPGQVADVGDEPTHDLGGGRPTNARHLNLRRTIA